MLRNRKKSKKEALIPMGNLSFVRYLQMLKENKISIYQFNEQVHETYVRMHRDIRQRKLCKKHKKI